MPGNVGRDVGQKFGQPRSSSSLSLNPGISKVTISSQTPMLVQTADGVEDRLQASAELAIVAIVEALEIHFVKIDPGMEILEHLRSSVAIRNKCRQQARLRALREKRQPPIRS